MKENVPVFFERCAAEPALKAKLTEAVAAYPGSLELRESLVEAVLLPIAAEEGLPFTVDELRAYETRQKLSRIKPDVQIEEGSPDEDADLRATGSWTAAGKTTPPRSKPEKARGAQFPARRWSFQLRKP